MTSEVMLIDDELDLSHLSATICAELAAGLADAEAVQKKYGILPAQWEALRANSAFRAMLKQAIETFSGDMNAGKRITVKSEIALEDSIPILYKMAHEQDSASGAKIDAIKMLTVLAGRNQKAATEGGGAGAGFNVNIHINTGGGADPVVVQGTVIEQD
jgi:hypothetical protein